MKPVPFAQYLASRQAAEPARESPVEKAPLTWPQAVKIAEAAERPRASPLLRKVERDATEDKAAHSQRIEQGRLIAFENGREAARKELDEERARMRDEIAAAVAKERRAWVEQQGDILFAAQAKAQQEFETRCAQSVANILRPFMSHLAIARVTEALVESLDALFAARTQALFEIAGPADLLDALRHKYAERDASIVFRPDDSIDVRVRVDDTIVETQLGAWLTALGAISEETRRDSDGSAADE